MSAAAPDMLAEALKYAGIGWPVFPCRADNKKPLVATGFKAATRDPDTIGKWWRKWPRALVAIPTGAASGVWVLDVDVDEKEKIDGRPAFAALSAGWEMPPTLRSRTPRGGEHYFFSWQREAPIPCTTGALARGIDTRGEGGYVVVPPSMRSDGKAYEWLHGGNLALYPAPPELNIALLDRRRPKANGANAPTNGHDHSAAADDRRRAYGEAALKGECDRVAAAPAGRRNHELHRAACRLAELCAGGVLGEAEARGALADAARAAGLDADEIDPTVESGFRKGSAEPRKPQERQARSERQARPQGASAIYDASDLQHETFPDLKQIAGDIVVEGLTLLAARPKVGKTWLALDIAVAVKTGGYCLGDIQCDQGDVLFLALEDNRRRMQRRLTKLLGARKGTWPRIAVAHTWPRADAGGVDDLRKWIAQAANPRLIVIDILGRFRKQPPPGKNSYDLDYAAVAELQTLASDTGVAIILVHHTRKGEADDPIDAVSGTLGIAGAADAVLIVDRTPQGVRLYGRSRDVDEIDRAIEFDRETCRWRILGDTADVRRSKDRQAILDALTEPMRLKDIAAVVGRPVKAVFKMVERMCKVGELVKTGRGFYARAHEATMGGNGGKGGNSPPDDGKQWWHN